MYQCRLCTALTHTRVIPSTDTIQGGRGACSRTGRNRICAFLPILTHPCSWTCVQVADGVKELSRDRITILHDIGKVHTHACMHVSIGRHYCTVQGAFGVVSKGTLAMPDGTVAECALKTLKVRISHDVMGG